MQRKPAAVLCLLVVGLLLACGRNGSPNSLFDSAGYHVRDGTVYYLNAFPGKAFEINGADAASFEALDSTYGRDKSTVYINGARLTDADAASFELLDGELAKDRRHVFQRDRAISDDPATFQLLAGAYARDDRRVFYFTDQIPDADLSSSKPLAGPYAADSAHIYWMGKTTPVKPDGPSACRSARCRTPPCKQG